VPDDERFGISRIDPHGMLEDLYERLRETIPQDAALDTVREEIEAMEEEA
jgi:hypothetical protein